MRHIPLLVPCFEDRYDEARLWNSSFGKGGFE